MGTGTKLALAGGALLALWYFTSGNATVVQAPPVNQPQTPTPGTTNGNTNSATAPVVATTQTAQYASVHTQPSGATAGGPVLNLSTVSGI